MEKKKIVEHLEAIADLMKLKGENIFKIRAFEKAADFIENQVSESDLQEKIKSKTLTDISGIGRGISEVILELNLRGTSQAKLDLEESFSPLLLEMVKIPGLGPKKVQALIDTLALSDLSELEYACKENRVAGLKGFGEKAQNRILEGIQFLNSNKGKKRLDEAIKQLEEATSKKRMIALGEVARKEEIIQKPQYLAVEQMQLDVKSFFDWLKVRGHEVFLSQLSEAELAKVKAVRVSDLQEIFRNREKSAENKTERGIENGFFREERAIQDWEMQQFEKCELKFIPAEARDATFALKQWRKKDFSGFSSTLNGFFHFHTTWSDGANTLEENLSAADAKGYQYVGVSEHSQSAFYAKGLKEDDLVKQRKEIDQVQKRFPQIKIYWGIESDILADGSLDYSQKQLARFDFVIASIHSRFQMGKKEMTERVVKALQNKATTFLGHPTGRLLLGRAGFELDWDEVCRVAAGQGVAIELNAHPSRLDVDWRLGDKLCKYGIEVGIHPDAHQIEGIDDIQYGIWMSNKAGIPATQIVNRKNGNEIEKWLKKRR